MAHIISFTAVTLSIVYMSVENKKPLFILELSYEPETRTPICRIDISTWVPPFNNNQTELLSFLILAS